MSWVKLLLSLSSLRYGKVNTLDPANKCRVEMKVGEVVLILEALWKVATFEVLLEIMVMTKTEKHGQTANNITFSFITNNKEHTKSTFWTESTFYVYINFWSWDFPLSVSQKSMRYLRYYEILWDIWGFEAELLHRKRFYKVYRFIDS